MSSLASRVAGLDVSAYVVRGVMIDSGFHHRRTNVADAVRSLGIVGSIVTHSHEDHAGNVSMLAQLGIPLSLRGDTERTLRERPAIQLYRRAVWGHPPPLVTAVTPFEHPDLVTVHTPGHSSDHQVVFDRQTGTLFSGDLWLGVHARVLHSTEDPYIICKSLRIAEALAPERMFDAHRGLVDAPRAALSAKAEWLTETLGELERRINEGWSDREIVRRILRGEDRVALVSRGDYSRRNLVKAVRRRLAARDRTDDPGPN
ncbi:MAG TPA: MBL fold metallo-hydrolase [Gemmatimonadaceae bacterium]|nr:MBL fold metallo-hydrolase [Gemmatimonadaceae bacterium]